MEQNYRQNVKFYKFSFIMFAKKLSAKASAKLELVLILWQQARIPTRDLYKCINHLLKMYETWKLIQKRVPGKRVGRLKDIETEFLSSLDNLFDNAHSDALKIIRFDEDRQFLLNQRQKGLPGCMTGVGMKLYFRDKRSSMRKEKEQARKIKYDKMVQENW